MRRLVGLVAATLILGAAAVATSDVPAQACSCVQISDQESLESADVVFEGVATSRSESSGGEHTGSYVWTFDVDRLFKGQVTDPQDVSAGASGSSCGVSFELQTAYRVYASRSESSSLTTHLCSATTKLANIPPTTATPSIAALQRTRSTSAGGATLVAVAMLAAVLGAGLGAALMRRRLQ